MAYRLPPKGQLTDLVIDFTGLKLFGEGELKVRKHGYDKRRVWRKLHLEIDPATHDIVAAEVILDTVHYAEVLPTQLNLLRRTLGTVFADGTYDTKACHPQKRASLHSPAPERRVMGRRASPQRGGAGDA